VKRKAPTNEEERIEGAYSQELRISLANVVRKNRRVAGGFEKGSTRKKRPDGDFMLKGQRSTSQGGRENTRADACAGGKKRFIDVRRK